MQAAARRSGEPDYNRVAAERLKACLIASLSSDLFQVEFQRAHPMAGHLVASPPLPVAYSVIRSWETRGWVHCVKRARNADGVDWRIYRVSEWGHGAIEDLDGEGS